MSVQQSSTWSDIKVEKEFPKLDKNLETDLVIVGGGLAGLLTAYVLARSGKRVVVLEKDRLGQGATSRTTAFITQIIDTTISEAKNIYGRRNLENILQSHGEAIDLIEKIVDEEKIDCEFMRCSNFFYLSEGESREDLEDECHIMKQFLPDVVYHATPLPGFLNIGAVETKHQAKFHVTKFLNGLVEAIEKLGVEIYENTEVKSIEGLEWVEARTDDYVVSAQYSLTATYDPLGNPKQTFMKKGMYVSYVYELEIPAGRIAEGIYEDDNNPYHYFRVDRQNGHDRMIVGGEDIRKEFEFDDEKSFKALREYLGRIFSDHDYKIRRKWSGWILEPSDGLALIGEFEHRKLLAAAFSGNGMTYSGIAAMIVRDIILKQKNPWIQIYDPKRPLTTRRMFSKGKDYIGEFFGGAMKNLFK